MTLKSGDVLFAAFLLGCLLLGGASREGFPANFVLQIGGAGLLGWGLYHLAWPDLARPERLLLAITGLGILLVMLQFVPLPASVWRRLPGREELALELDLLQAVPDPGFITLSVHESLSSAIWLVPALGLGMALLAVRTFPAIALSLILVGSAMLSIAIGLGQLAGGSNSFMYFYDVTNPGSMVGFFANANHMATLLLVTLPFIAALVRCARSQFPQHRIELTILGILLFVFVAIGVGLVGSMTGYALLGPVASCSALIVWPPSKRIVAAAALAGVIVFGAFMAVVGKEVNVFGSDPSSSLQSREMVRRDALPAAEDFFPVGTGLGTFEEVHRRYENRATISTKFVNHAHNDYLELLVELGAGGVVLILLFLTWWLYCLSYLAKSREATFGWAGWIAVGIILAHSVWDYPLRTAALSAVFALSCVLIARSARSSGAAIFQRTI